MEFDFERQAMAGELCPKKLDIADTCAYISLKHLYAMFKQNLISRKDATEEKKRIVYNWTTDKSKIEFLNRESDAVRNRIGKASEEYAKNATIENADKLYAAFYNLPDDWRKND